ncbi:hypothetical protein Dda_1547 [Drechslerella dactyloides]|uniref:Uncharacterized protein n=1 Tax=Drechslerella dactyloides TaxID=74499 RepID=A0AAD6NLI2_DREDA|nr:hypothetical protein Dda_1547 [Drechslerella dactyloides]
MGSTYQGFAFWTKKVVKFPFWCLWQGRYGILGGAITRYQFHKDYDPYMLPRHSCNCDFCGGFSMSHKIACEKFVREHGGKCSMPPGEYEVRLVRALEPGSLSTVDFSLPFSKLKYEWSGKPDKELKPGPSNAVEQIVADSMQRYIV